MPAPKGTSWDRYLVTETVGDPRCPRVAVDQAQSYSITSHLRCLPPKHKVLVILRDGILDWGHHSGQENQSSPLGRGDPVGHAELQQLGESSPQRRARAPFPSAPGCPHPVQQPHTQLRSQLFPPTAED